MSLPFSYDEPVVITGIGLITSVGRDRESVWQAVQRGQSGVRHLRGLRGIPDDQLIGATVDIEDRFSGRMKVFALSEHAAEEAMLDAAVDFNTVDLSRFGCSLNGHMGDDQFVAELVGVANDGPDRFPWWEQFLPNSACVATATKYALGGPRLCHSTACASSLISFLSAVRSIRDGQCDIALAGGGDAINPLFAAGFRRMRVLASASDPQEACRPFDRKRNGFVLGEGAAMFVIERLSHALARGARIYAEVVGGKMLAEAHHVTGLDADSEALTYLITSLLKSTNMKPEDVGYINVHGTGTEQNDLVEMRGIRQAFGDAAGGVCASATKSMLGHMIKAAGGVELAITTLAMRDGFAPPTVNLTDPDPECVFDALPLVGRENRFQNAIKLSVAFGGHLVGVALRRWNDPATGFSYPMEERAA